MKDSVPCRACGHNALTEKYRIRGYSIEHCPECFSLTTACRMDVENARHFYSDAYFRETDYHDYLSQEPVFKKNFSRFASRLLRFGSGGRMLELGCAYGFFLDIAKSHWDAEGIDISGEAVENCRARFGKKVRSGDLLSCDFEEGAYSWVVGWDMIEHIDNPRAYFKKCFQMLKPGGRVAFTTGDCSSLNARAMGPHWRLLTPPGHLTFFSRKGMKRSLEDAGFTTVLFQTSGYHRSLDFALYRLLGKSLHEKITKSAVGQSLRLKEWSFYLNLGDIMLVVAQKN